VDRVAFKTPPYLSNSKPIKKSNRDHKLDKSWLSKNMKNPQQERSSRKNLLSRRKPAKAWQLPVWINWYRISYSRTMHRHHFCRKNKSCSCSSIWLKRIHNWLSGQSRSKVKLAVLSGDHLVIVRTNKIRQMVTSQDKKSSKNASQVQQAFHTQSLQILTQKGYLVSARERKFTWKLKRRR